jgi:hypothetical protein
MMARLRRVIGTTSSSRSSLKAIFFRSEGGRIVTLGGNKVLRNSSHLSWSSVLLLKGVIALWCVLWCCIAFHLVVLPVFSNLSCQCQN